MPKKVARAAAATPKTPAISATTQRKVAAKKSASQKAPPQKRESPPSKKQRTPKAGNERKETLLLEELEEKLLLPLMDAGEVKSTSEWAGVMRTEEAPHLEKLEELPSLPFVNKYRIGKYYYKRECYDEYYKLVKDMLDDEEKCVTVTGTPVIGKSIFYGYFFQRFRKEMKEMEETKRKDTWIIAAAYRGGKLDSAIGFKDNDDDAKELLSGEEITDLIRAALKEKKNVLILSDGPPSRTWGWTQMVVFTSPNEDWMRSVRKDHCTLYMPLWTLTELQEAAEKLALQRRDGDRSYITGEVVEKRFYIFGGVARECFYLTEKLVKQTRNDLVAKIGGISNLEDVLILLRKNKNAAVCHRLLQFVAEHGDLIKTDLASPFVAQQLEKRVLEVVHGKREEVLKCLQDIPEGATLGGWMFEIGVHETLGRGCKLKLRPLLSKGSIIPGDHYRALTSEDLKIEVGETDVFTLENLSAVAATLGPYHKPESKQFESIDGFYISKMDPSDDLEETQKRLVDWNARPENRLILIQVTIAKNHPVNASGILNVLDKLGLVEVVKAQPERVALVFIVQKPEIAASYQRQKIHPERHDSLISVPHIGPVTVGKLNKLGIYCVDQLREAVAIDRNIVTEQVREGLKNLRDKSYSEAMEKIPQFVCCLPGADEDA